jgi:hypothetical protein
MTTKKYGYLIKPLSIGRKDKAKPKKKTGKRNVFFNVPEYNEQKVCLTGKELEGLNLCFDWGFKTKLGDWYEGRGLHIHPYPEVQFFVGLDTANINYLGAEIEICLGMEQEMYSFAEPTVIVIPAGFPHGPTTTKRIYSPKGFGFYLAALSAVTQIEWIANTKSGPSKGKYAHLVKPLKTGLLTERGKFNASRFTQDELVKRVGVTKESGFMLGPGNADHLAWFYGRDLEGLKVNLDWGFFSKPGLWHRGVGAHTHPVDEVLVFAGIDPSDIDYLGAEIEIDLGKEHERYIIEKPSVVICPAGLPHCPIITRWVDKPYAFFSINLSSQPESSYID